MGKWVHDQGDVLSEFEMAGFFIRASAIAAVLLAVSFIVWRHYHQRMVLACCTAEVCVQQKHDCLREK